MLFFRVFSFILTVQCFYCVGFSVPVSLKKPYEVRFAENKLSAEFELFDQNLLSHFEDFLKKEKVKLDRSETSWSRRNRLWQESRIDIDFAKVENDQSEALSNLKIQMSNLQFVLYYNSNKHPKAKASDYFLKNPEMKTASILGVKYLKSFGVKESSVTYVESPEQIFKMLKYSRIDYFLAPINIKKLFKSKPEYKIFDLGNAGTVPTYIYFHKEFTQKYKDFSALLAKKLKIWACYHTNASKPDYCTKE
ncbi:MAG: hypothetical protein VX583_14240 [Bdellovibrionota bacterium]